MIVSIDTGNKSIKTKNFTYIAGLAQYDSVPAMARAEDYIKYRGKYYCLTNQRQGYLRDKSKTDRYFILSLMGVAKELEMQARNKNIRYSADKVFKVTLLAGLPPAHMQDQQLKQNFIDYLTMPEPAAVTYKDQVWNIQITKVCLYAQCFAAMARSYAKIKNLPKVVGIDIGGMTADYLMMSRGSLMIEKTDSLENGVIRLYHAAARECMSRNDSIIDEFDVDEILEGNTEMYDPEDVRIVEEEAEKFVSQLFEVFRERGIDIRNSYVFFMGGGSLLLRKQIEKNPLVKRYVFIDAINANAVGYEVLYAISQKVA